MGLTAAWMSPVAITSLPESSGDSADVYTSGTPPSAGNLNLEPLALFVRSVAVELRDRQKKCLVKIVKGLDEYKKHLLFVNEWIQGEMQQVDLLLVSMKNLADLLTFQNKVQENITHQHNEIFAPDKLPNSVWEKQLKIHVILRNFALFMENTVRAIRFMN
ncbi:interleukin-6-like [Stegostoma tigrinum]|uniref:interleukin-6-like n=1 Tax=Stegostoma tigrinum TaxID=3053191 RepID=UPI00202B9A41|nr:interleukin-6-like [Stegostoma tigrinum]